MRWLRAMHAHPQFLKAYIFVLIDFGSYLGITVKGPPPYYREEAVDMKLKKEKMQLPTYPNCNYRGNI